MEPSKDIVTYRAYSDHDGVNIKKAVSVSCDVRALDKYGDTLRWTSLRKGVLVGIGSGTVRLRYPDPSYSKVQYLTTASTDLKSLAALFICGLVDPSIFADRLEEEFSEHREAADILREYEKVKREQDIANGK